MEPKNTLKISVLQGICCSLILLSYFLPWVQVSFMGLKGSFSLFDGMIYVTKLGSAASEINEMPSAVKDENYVWFLFLVPAVAFINAIIQWIGRYPRWAFYLNILPVSIGIGGMIFLRKGMHVDITDVAGIGLYLVVISGVVSIVEAWTTIGRHYSIYYKKYMRFLSYVILGCIIFNILYFGLLSIFGSSLHDKPEFVSVLFSVIEFVSGIAFIHAPFVIYAWIVYGCTRRKQQAELTAALEPETIAAVSPTGVSSVVTDILCPRCGRSVSSDWALCPYCCNNLKEEQGNEEDDNLRYAPPQYRNKN